MFAILVPGGLVMIEIFTIGHSNHDLLEFLDILKKYDVRMLVDLRSEPYSKYAPQFNKSEFQQHVEAAGIKYRYSGSSIGGKPKDTSLYTSSGKPDYDKLAATPQFQDELKAITALAEKLRIVLMCSEGNPTECHRERIIAPVLKSWGIKVVHILPDGNTEETMQQRLF